MSDRCHLFRQRQQKTVDQLTGLQLIRPFLFHVPDEKVVDRCLEIAFRDFFLILGLCPVLLGHDMSLGQLRSYRKYFGLQSRNYCFFDAGVGCGRDDADQAGNDGCADGDVSRCPEEFD